jgi:hypothetical protein
MDGLPHVQEYEDISDNGQHNPAVKFSIFSAKETDF